MDYSIDPPGVLHPHIDIVEELKRLSMQADLQTKLLFTLASVVRKNLRSGCVEARAISDQMQDLRGGVKEHLRAEAALARKLREMGEDAS
ncbi:MAG: hypothetical protein V3S71_06490 [Acidobacteriota bacterium]